MTRTRKVLLLMESARTCERDFLRGVARFSRSHGHWAFYQKPKHYIKPNRRQLTFSQIRDLNPDAVIVSDTENYQQITALKIPIIVHTIKARVFDIPSIIGDCLVSGKMAAQHLLENGFKNFAFCGLGDYYWSKDRYKSFKNTITQAGFNVRLFELPVKPRRSTTAQQKKLLCWLNSLPKPIGLMTCADDCSQIIAETCKLTNIKVPEEVAVIGVDNDDMVCDLSDPPLSSVALDFETAGYEAAELLDKLMAGGKKPKQKTIIVKATHVVTRESTNALAIEDQLVAGAVRFIRQNSTKLIQVDDVLTHAGCSRRWLDQKFKRTIGRSVHEEIKRARIEQIAVALRETEMPVSQIALKFGYSDSNHIARYFQQQKGINPLAYRKKFTHK